MKRLKQLSPNFALLAFAAFVIKMLIVEASFADSIIIAVLGSLYGYTQYLKRFQAYNLDEEVKRELLEVKGALSKLNLVKTQEKLKNNKYF